MSASLYNGFPIVTSDTGAYINMGFEFRIPYDRPPYYGLFIRLSSLWTSLWYPVVIQCMIAALLLSQLTKLMFINSAFYKKCTMLSLLAIASFTCLPWVLGQLMPDAFTGILLMAVILFYLKKHTIVSYGCYAAIIFLSLLFHSSHVLIIFCLSACIIVFGLKRNWQPMVRKSAAIFCLGLAVVLLSCTVSYIKGHGFRFSRGSHVFLMGRLGETGILKKYLDENCSGNSYKLCEVKDDIQGRAWEFIWSDNGPFHKSGGWENSKAEYDAIIKGVLTDPEYLSLFIQKSVISTLRQLTQVTLPEKFPALSYGSSPANSVKFYFEDEITEYNTSLQNSGNLEGRFFNQLYFLFFLATSLIIIYKYRTLLNEQDIKIYCIVIVFLVCNAFVTACFANVLDRLQHRVFWVLPAVNVILLLRRLIEIRSKKLATQTLS